MVDRSASLKKISDIKYYAAALYDDVTLSTGDTVTPSEFSIEDDLKKAVIMRNDTGAELTCTVLLNVITVTSAAIVDEVCTLFVFGRRA